MNSKLISFFRHAGAVVLTMVMVYMPWMAAAAENADVDALALLLDKASPTAGNASSAGELSGNPYSVAVEALEANDYAATAKPVAWLGVSTTEASDALASQLNLPVGAGLLVEFVAPDSPAAKAGLQKNDVLFRLDDQSLVHPAQLRKLVQVRKEGEAIKLKLYRGGKEQTVPVTLAKMPRLSNWEEATRNFDLQFGHYNNLYRDSSTQFNDQIKAFRDAIKNFKVDDDVKQSIRKSMDEARKTLREALLYTTNVDVALEPVRKTLEELSRSKVLFDDNASVTVRSAGKGVKSVVKADDSGTIVLVNQPKLHLTVHDKEGKLLFDGEIENKNQRDAVPRDVWERVEPLVDKMQTPEPEAP